MELFTWCGNSNGCGNGSTSKWVPTLFCAAAAAANFFELTLHYCTVAVAAQCEHFQRQHYEKHKNTRMHSSRMHTGRTLTVFRWRAPPPKIWRKPPEKLEEPPLENLEEPPPPPLWTEWMTDACENITLTKTSFRPVIIAAGLQSLVIEIICVTAAGNTLVTHWTGLFEQSAF